MEVVVAQTRLLLQEMGGGRGGADEVVIAAEGEEGWGGRKIVWTGCESGADEKIVAATHRAATHGCRPQQTCPHAWSSTVLYDGRRGDSCCAGFFRQQEQGGSAGMDGLGHYLTTKQLFHTGWMIRVQTGPPVWPVR